MTPTIRRATCGLLLTGALAGTAVAATPESGTVSIATPKVTWTGETTASYPVRILATQNEDVPCEAPFCDSFALKVDDSANLTLGVSVDSDSDTSIVTTRVHLPDGSMVQAHSPEGAAAAGKIFKVVVKNAAKGDYVIDHMNNATGARANSSFAELAVAAAPQQPTPADPNQPNQPGPAPVQAIDLQVTVGKASARKLARSRKLAAKVTVSREVSSITASLKKGSKVVGKGSLGRSSGTKTLSVRLPKKIKRGSYALAVTATDGQTSTSRTVKVKVSK